MINFIYGFNQVFFNMNKYDVVEKYQIKRTRVLIKVLVFLLIYDFEERGNDDKFKF